MTRTFSELNEIDGFTERFEYLALQGSVGTVTFGHDRWLNQQFYRSLLWKQMRHHIIARDNGCDLATEGYEIHDRVIIHHMNPINLGHLVTGNTDVLDPEFLISTTQRTHNAIHYGDRSLLMKRYLPRRNGDTMLW